MSKNFAYVALGASLGSIAMLLASTHTCKAACVDTGKSMMTCTSTAPMPVHQPVMFVAQDGLTYVKGNNQTAMQVMGASDDAARDQRAQAEALAYQRAQTIAIVEGANAIFAASGYNLRMGVR